MVMKIKLEENKKGLVSDCEVLVVRDWGTK
jgi:hypothetical protein